MKTLLKLALLLGLTQLVAHAQVVVNGSTIIAGGSPTQAVTSVNGNPGALVLTGSGASCVFASGTTTCTFSGGGGSGGFPFVLGSTSVGANSTVTSVSGLTVNGVALNSTGSASLFLNQQGAYVAPTGSGTVNSGTANELSFYPATGTAVGPAPNLWTLTPSMTVTQVNALIASLTPGSDVVIIPPSFPQVAFTNNSYVETVDLRPNAMTVTVGGAGVACDANQQSTVVITSGSNIINVGADPSAVAGHTMTVGQRTGYNYTAASQVTWTPTILSVAFPFATMSSNAPFSYTGRVTFGTDNTAALQQIFNNAGPTYPMWIPTGCQMLTGPIAWNNSQSILGQQMGHNGFISMVAKDILQQPDSSGGGNVSGDGVRVENVGFAVDSPVDPTFPITDYAANGSSSVRAPLYRPAHMAPEAQDANNPLAPGWMTNASNGVASITQNSAVICVPNALGRLPAVGQVIVFPYQTAVFTSTIASAAGSCSAGFTARTMAGAFPNTSGYTVAQAEWVAGTAVQQITSTIAANPTLPLTVNLSLPTQPVPGFESNFASHGHIRFGSSECDYLGNGNYGTTIVLRRCNSIPGYTGPITVVPMNPCSAKNQFYAAADQPWPVIPNLNTGDSTPSGANYFPGLCVGAAAISFPQANGNVWAGGGLGHAFLEHIDFNGDAVTPQDAFSTAAMYMAGNTASYGADFGGWNVNYYQYGIVQGPASSGMHGVAAVGPTGDANTYHDISIHAAYALTFDDLQNSHLDHIDTYCLEFSPYDGTAVGPGTCIHFGYTVDEQTGLGVTTTSVNELTAWEGEPELGNSAEVPVYAQLDQYYGTYDNSNNFEGAFTIIGGTGNVFSGTTMHIPVIDYGTANHFQELAGLTTQYITNQWPNGFMEWGVSNDCSYVLGGSVGPSFPCSSGEIQPVSGRSIAASATGGIYENPESGKISSGEWNTFSTLDSNPMTVNNVIDPTEPYTGRYAGCNLGGTNICTVFHFDGFTGQVVVSNNGRIAPSQYDISADFESPAGAGQFTMIISAVDGGSSTCSSPATLATYTITTAASWPSAQSPWQSPTPVNFAGYTGCSVAITFQGATTTDQYRVGKFDFVPVPNHVLLPTASPTIGNPCAGPNRIVGANASGPITCYNGTYVQASGGGGSGFPITLGSTTVAASSTTTTIAGMTLTSPITTGETASGATITTSTFNGVNLSAAGSANSFLTNAGTYVPGTTMIKVDSFPSAGGTFAGTYSGSTTYTQYQTVTSSGADWICLSTCLAVTPAAATAGSPQLWAPFDTSGAGLAATQADAAFFYAWGQVQANAASFTSYAGVSLIFGNRTGGYNKNGDWVMPTNTYGYSISMFGQGRGQTWIHQTATTLNYMVSSPNVSSSGGQTIDGITLDANLLAGGCLSHHLRRSLIRDIACWNPQQQSSGTIGGAMWLGSGADAYETKYEHLLVRGPAYTGLVAAYGTASVTSGAITGITWTSTGTSLNLPVTAGPGLVAYFSGTGVSGTSYKPCGTMPVVTAIALTGGSINTGSGVGGFTFSSAGATCGGTIYVRVQQAGTLNEGFYLNGADTTVDDIVTSGDFKVACEYVNGPAHLIGEHPYCGAPYQIETTGSGYRELIGVELDSPIQYGMYLGGTGGTFVNGAIDEYNAGNQFGAGGFLIDAASGPFTIESTGCNAGAVQNFGGYAKFTGTTAGPLTPSSSFLAGITGAVISGANQNCDGTSTMWGVFPVVPATPTGTICSGTQALGTTLIASGAAASTISVTCTGLLSSDVCNVDFATSPLGVTGYVPSTNGSLYNVKWMTTNTLNIATVNDTSASVTPGAISVNYRCTR